MAYRVLSDVSTTQTFDEIQQGLVQKYLTVNELTAWMDTIVTDRPAIRVNRVLDVGSVQAGMDCNTSFTSYSLSAASYSFPLIKYGRQFEVCADIEEMGSTFVDQMAEESINAVAALTEKIGQDTAGSGNGSSAVFGLGTLVTNSFAVSTSGALALNDLWKLKDEVRAKSGKMAYITNSATRRSILNKIAAASLPGSVELKGSSFTVPTFDGMPILAHDSISNGTCYLVNGSVDNGLFFAIGQNSQAGLFQIDEVGKSQTKDTMIYRIKTNIASVLKSTQAIAALTGIPV